MHRMKRAGNATGEDARSSTHRSDLLRRFFLDYDFQVCGHVLVQLYGDGEISNCLQRLLQVDLAPNEVEAFLGQRGGQIAGGNRSEKLLVFTRSTLERKRKTIELLGKFFGL